MACETTLKPRQTVSQRADEVRRVASLVSNRLAAGLIKVRVGQQGAIAFSGITDEQRDGVTDACIYRRIMVTGSPLAKLRIAQAEQLAGRAVDRNVIGQGVHSHDGGQNWHGKG